MIKLLLLLFSLRLQLCGCRPEVRENGFARGRSQYQVSRLGRLPEQVRESSGLELAPDSTLWTHNDDQDTRLYRISFRGELRDSLLVPQAKNVDWEALAQDDSATLYIGDFGNNLNRRRDLVIYRLSTTQPETTGRIAFRYADQTAFPPTKEQRDFDCEAMYWLRDSLYLFSKNRGSHQVKLYRVPTRPGTYAVPPEPQRIYLRSQVTAAAISPDGRTVALLGYGKVYLFRPEGSENPLTKPWRCLRLPRGQAEGLVFVTNSDFIISNENRKLFLVKQKSNASSQPK